jgi:hypothetical protein
MIRFGRLLLVCLVLPNLAACGHHFGECDDFGDCGCVHGRVDWCGCDPDCRDDDRDDWSDDDRDDDWDDDPYTFCDSDADCPAGFVCPPDGVCVETVMGCPLTDECLADPEGYAPEWQGIDPFFVGSFEGPGVTGRVRVFIDFYEDHLFGQGEVVAESAEGYQEWLEIVVTGTRDGADLWGQVVDPNAWEREFDAVFSATLLSASEMHGVVTVSSDQGDLEASFVLYRTSPCGCETDDDPDGTCELNEDCAPGQVCIGGACVDVCLDDDDCPEGQICDCHICIDACTDACCDDADCGEGELCVDGACVAECQTACCEDADCPEGDVCVEGACQTPCELNCQCGEGEICVDGYCQEGEPPPECTSDCDCDYDAGERCIDGFCQMP